MKKRVLKIILVSVMFLSTGCVFSKENENKRNEKPYLLQTEQDVYKYLEDEYPNEEFEIINWEYINEYTNARNWYIKSLKHNIEFKIYDSSKCKDANKTGCSKEDVIYIIEDTYDNILRDDFDK